MTDVNLSVGAVAEVTDAPVTGDSPVTTEVTATETEDSTEVTSDGAATESANEAIEVITDATGDNPNAEENSEETEGGDDHKQLNYSQEDYVEYPITLNWVNTEAEEVTVSCNIDNFTTATPLAKSIVKTKKGRTKQVFRGTLSLPPGKWLIRYKVDGEQHCDEGQEVIHQHGEDYNPIIVTKDEGSEDDEEKKDSETASETDRSGDESNKANDSRTQQDDAAGTDGTGTLSVEMPSTPTSDQKIRRKKERKHKKKRHAVSAVNAAHEPVDLEHPVFQEDFKKREKEWREAWVDHKMQTYQSHEAEKQLIRDKMKQERKK